MSVQPEQSRPLDWMDGSGLRHLLRTFKIAIHPSKLVLALCALLLTFLWGILLDWIWTSTGNGVHEKAIPRYIAGIETEVDEEQLTEGVFDVFADFQLGCIRDAIESVRHGRIIGAVKPGAAMAVSFDPTTRFPMRGAFANLVLMGRGFIWLTTQHVFYAILFLVVALLIWGFLGGAICRLAALQFGRDEAPTVGQVFQFTKGKLLGGFFMAPIVPLLICFGVGLALFIGGLVLRIPYVGDVIVALTFFLALFGGFVIALVAVGTVAAGSLFMPTVAVEGSDCFDAISRSFSYFFGRPLRLIWYALIAVVYGSLSWLIIKFVIWLTLASTHLFVNFGSGEKLEAFWDAPTMDALHSFITETEGNWQLVWGVILGLWILPLRVLPWAFLASFYLSGSTIAYFLLRRDVDETDLGEVYVEEEEPIGPPPAESTEESKPAESTGSAPATEEEATGEQPTDEAGESETEETEKSADEEEESDESPPETDKDRRDGE